MTENPEQAIKLAKSRAPINRAATVSVARDQTGDFRIIARGPRGGIHMDRVLDQHDLEELRRHLIHYGNLELDSEEWRTCVSVRADWGQIWPGVGGYQFVVVALYGPQKGFERILLLREEARMVAKRIEEVLSPTSAPSVLPALLGV